MNYAFNTPIEFAEFSDCKFFELIVDDNDKYKIKYIKGDNTIKLNIDFDEFKNVINNKTWSDETVADFCQFNDNNNNNGNNKSTDNTDSNIKSNKSSKKKGLLALVIVLSALNASILAFLIYRFIKRNNNNKNIYYIFK